VASVAALDSLPSLRRPEIRRTEATAGADMKDLFQVLRQKELDVERVRKEIEALHFVIPLLAEEADWIENGLAPPRFRATGTADRRPVSSRSNRR